MTARVVCPLKEDMPEFKCKCNRKIEQDGLCICPLIDHHERDRNDDPPMLTVTEQQGVTA